MYDDRLAGVSQRLPTPIEDIFTLHQWIQLDIKLSISSALLNVPIYNVW
jgi:hypothetical protein